MFEIRFKDWFKLDRDVPDFVRFVMEFDSYEEWSIKEEFDYDPCEMILLYVG